MKKLILFLFILSAFFSCTKNEIEPAESYFNYFPLSQGSQRTYKITRITIDKPTAIQDTLVYYVRETIQDTIIDTLDYSVYFVSRETRENDTLFWKFDSQYSIRKHTRSIVTVEQNQAFVSLTFPQKEDKTWDGNEFNILDQENYTYSSVAAQDSIQGQFYDSILVVKQQFFESLFSYQQKEEKYAYNVGLCSKIVIDVESQPNDDPNFNYALPILERITKGSIMTVELVSYSIK